MPDKIQCPCQVPIDDNSICPSCEQQIEDNEGGIAFVYIQMDDGGLSGCSDECPCEGTGFVPFEEPEPDCDRLPGWGERAYSFDECVGQSGEDDG